MAEDKSRVSYDKKLRSDAKSAGRGLITISVTHPSGDRDEFQFTGSATDCRFAKWAGVALGCEEARGCLPNLEDLIRNHVEANSDETL